MSRAEKFDVHQDITNRIVAAIETAGAFRLPWARRSGGAMKRPVNIDTGKPYNGVNIVSLWVEALAADHPSNVWGTYRQWQARGCQVRKGQKSYLVVFYRKLDYEKTNDVTGETEPAERLMARASFVFNAGQVDGFSPEEPAILPDGPVFDPIEHAERFAHATGASIREGGEHACYEPASDLIRMPDRARFTGSPTSTPAEAYYSTLCHELVHWTGTKERLGRDLSGRFGSASYAVEELVAELGAAFLCSDLGIALEPRIDHAQYIASWLKVLKDDKRAIFTASAKASEATSWLLATAMPT
jgi:antirestriction protein ArdC